jgi:hypothetical protein
MISLRIGQGELEYLKLSVNRPLLPAYLEGGSFDYLDHNWIRTIVEVRAGAFEGRYRTDLHRDEFEQLREELPKLYSFEIHEIKFSAMEGQLGIDITGDRRGNFEVCCKASDCSDGNCLDFRLGFDQTQIPRMIHELDAILAAYPLRGERPPTGSK